MSRNFLNTPNFPYIGVPYSSPITVCEPSREKPVVLPFPIQWLSYGAGASRPAVSVEINISQPGNQVVIDKIRSVFIDNLNNNVPVYVYFPSSNFTVAAQPNSQGWYTAITNDLRAFVIGNGFTNADSLSNTLVCFTNILIQPTNNLELAQTVGLLRASPSIQRGNTIYNSKYAPAALGDQTVQKFINFQVTPFQQTVLSAQASGFYVITNIVVNAAGMFNAGGSVTGRLTFGSTGPSGLLYTMYYAAADSQQGRNTPFIYNVASMNNCQIKINANETWVFNVLDTISQGVLSWIMNYTYQPTDT